MKTIFNRIRSRQLTPTTFRTAAVLLIAAFSFESACAAADPGYVYWSTVATTGPNTSNSQIKRARLDGSATETILSGPTTFRFGGIAFDVDHGFLYSGDGSTLFRADLDGGNRTVLVTNTGVADIELDLVHGKIYWTDNLRDVVWRANLDGSGAETIVSFLFADNVEGLAVDPVGGKLFMTYDTSPPAAAILVANLDGSGTNLFKSLSTASFPFDIEIDAGAGVLYWNDPNKIYQTLLDGSGAVEVAFTPANRANNGIHFDSIARKIYFSGGELFGLRDLSRANLDGSNAETLLTEPDGINYIEVIRPRPVLAIDRYAGIMITGQTGVTYQIQYSTDLNSPSNWTALTNLTLPSSPYLFFDASSGNRPTSFYRAVSLP